MALFAVPPGGFCDFCFESVELTFDSASVPRSVQMNQLRAFVIAGVVSGAVSVVAVGQRGVEPPTRSPTYPTPAPQTSATAADQLTRDYEIAFNKGDAKALAALYTEDAVRLGPDNRMLRGRAAIQQFYVQDVGSGTTPKLTIRPARTRLLRDDVAVLEGAYELADGTGGVYVITALQERGEWRMAAVVPVPDR